MVRAMKLQVSSFKRRKIWKMPTPKKIRNELKNSMRNTGYLGLAVAKQEVFDKLCAGCEDPKLVYDLRQTISGVEAICYR